MDKIQVTEQITDYKDCIFWKMCEKYKDRCSEPDARCEGCPSYTSTILANKLKWD